MRIRGLKRWDSGGVEEISYRSGDEWFSDAIAKCSGTGSVPVLKSFGMAVGNY